MTKTSMGRVGREVLLAMAALAGLACVLWFVASTFLGWTVVEFRTGSMAPTMPTGTAAIAVPVKGEDISVGDVVLVERQGQLPVTHRVVSVEPLPNGAELVLKGDVNEAPDPAPYQVEEALQIVFPVPALGTVLSVTRQPVALGITTIAVAGLVLWVFWPRPRPDQTVVADDAPEHQQETDDELSTPRSTVLVAESRGNTC